MRRDCLARQQCDQLFCGACGLVWDVNDPEPPQCQKVDRRLKVVKEVTVHDAEGVKLPNGLPETLSADLAEEMDKAYKANAGEGLAARLRGMRAAYRVFLDKVEL